MKQRFLQLGCDGSDAFEEQKSHGCVCSIFCFFLGLIYICFYWPFKKGNYLLCIFWAFEAYNVLVFFVELGNNKRMFGTINEMLEAVKRGQRLVDSENSSLMVL